MPSVTRNPPEPKIERISNLVHRIQNGDIKIPKFQRGFVWDEGQIIKLLESIYEGYPIGSLLFWLSDKPMRSERDIGGFELPQTPDKYPRNYVLDGQQRLTTIYGVLNWPNSETLHKLNVYFDLDKQKFHHYAGKEEKRHIPLSVLNSTSAFLDFQRKNLSFESDDRDDLIERANVLYETFREYLIPVVTIKEKNVQEVCPIFERINSSGTQLNVFDLMVAATWSDDFDLNDQVSKIRESAKLKDFEDINNTIFLKIMSSIADIGSKEEHVFKLRDMPSEKLIELAKKVQEAVERTVDFLSTDLAVPSDAFLPYQYQMVVFSYFFSKVRNPTNDQLTVLRRYFWQTGFSEHYRGAEEGVLEHDLAEIDRLVKGDNDVFRLPFYITVENLARRQFVKMGAFTKTFAVLLARKNPKNITNGEAIDTEVSLSIFNNKEFHHIFPKEFLKRLGVESAQRNSISNVCMISSSQNKQVLTTPPSNYLAKSAKELDAKAKEVFESNLIPFESNASWRSDKYESFLTQRASLILEEIKSKW
jgi:hypothetical protein